MTRLDILTEFMYDNRRYFVDKDDKNQLRFYTVAPGVNCPNSPIVSYKVYNDSKYYEQITESKFIDALMKSYNKSIDNIE